MSIDPRIKTRRDAAFISLLISISGRKGMGEGERRAESIMGEKKQVNRRQIPRKSNLMSLLTSAKKLANIDIKGDRHRHRPTDREKGDRNGFPENTYIYVYYRYCGTWLRNFESDQMCEKS